MSLSVVISGRRSEREEVRSLSVWLLPTLSVDNEL